MDEHQPHRQVMGLWYFSYHLLSTGEGAESLHVPISGEYLAKEKLYLVSFHNSQDGVKHCLVSTIRRKVKGVPPKRCPERDNHAVDLSIKEKHDDQLSVVSTRQENKHSTDLQVSMPPGLCIDKG